MLLPEAIMLPEFEALSPRSLTSGNSISIEGGIAPAVNDSPYFAVKLTKPPGTVAIDSPNLPDASCKD